MKLSQYLSSLLPTFGRNQVIEDCRLTKTEITEFTQPAYDIALPLLKGWKFKSPILQSQMGTFGRMVKSVGNDNAVVTIQKSFKNILANLSATEEMINKTYNEDVASAGLTYLKANLLQFVEATAFVSKFARKFLIYIYICETSVLDDGETVVDHSLSKAEIEWIGANFVSFCTALNIVSGDPSNVKKLINSIPDIVITSENVATLGASLGESKIDPFQMKLIPIWMNPIYHVGMFVAEWQADRYKVAKEEVKLLQLRRLNLEKLSDGKPDARVQHEINYMETRIQGMNYKINKMETAHG